jgi:hypothetical protein
MPFLFDTVSRDITEIFVTPPGHRWTSIIFHPCGTPTQTLYNGSRFVITQTLLEAELFDKSSPYIEFCWGPPSPIVFPRLYRQNALSVNQWKTLV